MLSTSTFVTTDKHGHALAQQQRRQFVLDLSQSKPLNGLSMRRSLRTIVAAEIVVVSVSVRFSVGFVVFSLVTNEVIQCETIMRGNEIDAVIGSSTARFVEIA